VVAGVTMTGTVRHEGRIYSIRRMRGGVQAIAIVEMTRSACHRARADARAPARRPELARHPLVRNGDASMLRSFLRSLQPSRPKRSGTEREANRPRGQQETLRSACRAARSSGAPPAIVINVMVATRRSRAKVCDIKRELVELAVEEANQSFRNSNLGHIRLELVHAYQNRLCGGRRALSTPLAVRRQGHGAMEEVHGLRETSMPTWRS